MASTAQDFVRALRAPTDPPAPGGPSKLSIAREVWTTTALYVPNKAEVIAEWLLARLLKEKDSSRDLDSWALLRDVLVDTDATRSRAARAWLAPILQRTPLAPIAVAALGSWAQLSSAQVSPAAECLSILWPLAVAKFTAETLLDCFGAVLRLLRARPDVDAATRARVDHFAEQVITSYRHALANASNKKKVLATFVARHFLSWLQCISSTDRDAPLYASVYDAGVETLFNADALRQAQDRDDSPYSEYLSNAMAADAASLCHCLPRLFEAFIRATKRHRAAVFGQSSHQAPGSSADQARLAALKFLALCDTLLGDAPTREIRWHTLGELLRIADAEGLYGANNGPATEVLRRCGEDAVTLLADAIRADQLPLVEHALDVVSTITHFDYDLLSHLISRVLPLLLSIPSSVTTAYVYLKHLLDYHAKTRTMDVLVEALLKACMPQTYSNQRAGIDAIRLTASTSPLLRYDFLDDFALSLKTFLTPGQISSVVECVLKYLREQVGTVEAATQKSDEEGGKPQKKKRKVDSVSPTTNFEELHRVAVAASLMSRIGSIVLASFPTRYLQEDQLHAVTETIQDFYASMRSALKDIPKKIKHADKQTTLALQWAASSILQLQYTIRSSPSLQVSTQGDEKFSSKLLSALSSHSLVPELRVMMLHVLMSDVDLGYCEPSPVFDEVLNLLDGHENAAATHWTGNVYYIQDELQALVATCHVLFNRWLPVFDAGASQEQLARLAKLMISPQFIAEGSSSAAQHILLRNVLQQALHNAEVWELHRLRDSLLEQINAVTKSLDSIDVASVLSAIQQGQKLPAQLPDAIPGAYRLLLYIPIEYLSRNLRNDLLRRALAADVLAASKEKNEYAQSSLFFREFLRRLFVFMGTAEHSAIGPYLSFLLQRSPALPFKAFVSTTSELIKMHLSVCVKSSLKGDSALIQDVLTYFTSFVTNRPPFVGEELQQSIWHGLINLIDIVSSETKPDSFNKAVLEQLQTLHQAVSSALLPRLAESRYTDMDVYSQSLLLSIWHRSLVFQRCIRSTETLPSFGKAIVTRLLLQPRKADPARSQLYLAALSIVQEECQSREEGQQGEYLEVVLASYLAFYASCEEKARHEMDELVSRFVKSLSTAGYSVTLDLVLDGLSVPGLKLADTANLIHLLTLILQNAPEGSSKIMQASLTRCLQLFASKREFMHEGSVRVEVLRFISKQFNDRPALVRQLDLTALWSILGSSVEGSSIHESSTDKAAFQEIVSTLSALIRLRRDIVTSSLPQLAYIFRRLLLSMRHLRPQLGAKQSKMVTDTLPRWISPHEPLSAEEAKALARLLTTMTTKTTVRGQSSSTDAGKAESLARPFSKHAAYVLQAYIDALNDPLCMLPSDVRKELEPGLFALCDMMGEHSRDALMVASLDAGGKTVLKTVWREYEKQKYVGRG